MNRRRFMGSILAACAAPYVVTAAGVLMPVRALAAPQTTLTVLGHEEFFVGELLRIDGELFEVTHVNCRCVLHVERRGRWN